MLVIMFEHVFHANFEIILAVLTLLVVLFLGLLLVQTHEEAERFSRYWLEEKSRNRDLRDSFNSLITMVLKQATEVKDNVTARKCEAMLESLSYGRAPAEMITRLPVIPHEINLNPPEKSARTKYFKGIMSDGNPV
jgi:hypothetical protein